MKLKMRFVSDQRAGSGGGGGGAIGAAVERGGAVMVLDMCVVVRVSVGRSLGFWPGPCVFAAA